MENIGNKILSFLEKYVQWIAVALGGLFLLWMIKNYALQNPIVAQVGNKGDLAPRDVDQTIYDGPAKALQAAMANTSVPKMEVQDFVADLMNRLNPPNNTALALTTPWSNLPLPETFERAQPQQPTFVNKNPVVNLIAAAAPDDLKVEQGRSNVQIPPPADPNNPNNNNGSPIVQVSNTQGKAEDRNWVSISAMIRTKPLADALAQTNVPAGPLRMITVLRVDLIRQEQDSNGDWGPDQVIGPISTVNLQPLPDQQAPIANQIAYIQWAEKQDSQQALLQPPFYPVLQADVWVVPGMPQIQPTLQLPDQPFDPSKFTGDPDDLTPDQKKQYDDYQKQLRQQRMDAARARQQQEEQRYAPRGGGPGGPGDGGPGQQVLDDPDRPLTLAQATPGYGGPGGPYGNRPPGGPPPGWRPPGFPGAMPTPAANPAAQQPNPDDNGAMANSPLANPQATLPPGAFDPAIKSPPDIVIWAHDDTVEAGKTYRYKLRYVIKNPVFQTRNVCKPQKLAEQFSIDSADSAWTDPISIKSETNVFAVTASSLARNSVPVKFDIFRWNGGAWRQQTDTVNPGDEVGTKDPTTGVDFSTGLTLVDVRNDPRNTGNQIITLMSDSGQISRHMLPDDRNNPEHKKLKIQVSQAAAAAAAAAATNNGQGANANAQPPPQ